MQLYIQNINTVFITCTHKNSNSIFRDSHLKKWGGAFIMLYAELDTFLSEENLF